jgi:hypothetical protein
MEQKKRKSIDRIVLMDLNVALSSNFKEMRYHNFETFVKEVEEYRDWMVELLRNEYVVLITARDTKWGKTTLNRIWDTQKWSPNHAMFNDTGISGADAHLVKKHQVLNKVFPIYGDNPKQYFAIESNSRTREMYSSLGITAFDCEREGMWENLPF